MAHIPPIRLVISGSLGRMGSLIAQEALADRRRFQLVGVLEHPGHPSIGQPYPLEPKLKVQSDLKTLLKNAEILIEFTTPEATLKNAEIAAASKIAMVIGTTGFSAPEVAKLRALAKTIPIFWSANMSTGVLVVRKTIQSIRDWLSRFGLEKEVQIHLSETHHIHKKDKPSGTAKQLAADLTQIFGRQFPEDEIEAKREGEVVGLHQISFEIGPERIILEHQALDRRVFALGALRVATYFHAFGNRPGWYGMDDLTQSLQKR